jgi:hypothetical protein
MVAEVEGREGGRGGGGGERTREESLGKEGSSMCTPFWGGVLVSLVFECTLE